MRHKPNPGYTFESGRKNCKQFKNSFSFHYR